MLTVQPLHLQFGSINPNRYNAWNFDTGRPGGLLSVESLAGIPDELSYQIIIQIHSTQRQSIEFNIPIASQ